MRVPITVNYVPDGDDWTVTVAVAGEDTAHRARAAGLIAARDQADQLVDRIAPDDDTRRVVHLLEGDAYAFTTTYLHARLGLSGAQANGQADGPPDGLADGLADGRPEGRPNGRDEPPEATRNRHRTSTDQVITNPAEQAPDWPDSSVETAGPTRPAGTET